MGLYNFQPRFAPRIRAWATDPDSADAKAHTIRGPRKGGREDKPGDTMYLYTGLRQKPVNGAKVAERIVEPPICAKRESIVIAEYGPGRFKDVYVGPFLADVLDDTKKQRRVIASPGAYGLVLLPPDERLALARRDGFESFAEMMAFWNGRLPFYGHIFHCRKADPAITATICGLEKPPTKRTALALATMMHAAHAELTRTEAL